ncbi:MAG: ATP-binding protein, partial [Pseudomonadota bacterium]
AGLRHPCGGIAMSITESSWASGSPERLLPIRATRDWQLLGYLNLYRMFLACLLALLLVWGVIPRAFGMSDVGIFRWAAILYVGFGVLCLLLLRNRIPTFNVQLMLAVAGDVSALGAMMYASGGVASGFGMLMIVAVAGASIVSGGRLAFLFAAAATLAVLVQQLAAAKEFVYAADYTHAAFLGVVFFCSAALAHTAAQRIRASEALAAKRGLDLANLAQLNEHIIHRMQSGIVAVDSYGVVVMSNESAQTLLGVSSERRALDAISPALNELYERWRIDRDRSSYTFMSTVVQVEVMASFAALGSSGMDGALVFLEDASAVRSRAQSLKLASLGRLTASIAHEIRNPLGAISHAEQLLGESENLDMADRRLSRIIKDNCQRMNGIIEDVLQLSRRSASVLEDVMLEDWLQGFLSEFGSVARDDRVELHVEPSALMVRFDRSQLHQVVRNLTENAIFHGGERGPVKLIGGVHADTERPFLDILDQGEGIAPDAAEQIFEPFFTTRGDGTGLGLYIARELCEANQAALHLLPSDRGSRFRITFADPRRQSAMTL